MSTPRWHLPLQRLVPVLALTAVLTGAAPSRAQSPGLASPETKPQREAPLAHPIVGGLEAHAALPPRLAGNVLISELGCAACHPSGSAAMAPKAGPDLSEAGSRMDPRHLRRFIANAAATKPGTTMPDVLAGLPAPEREQAALALASYLTSLGTGRLAFDVPASDAIERGRALYHSVGCVACHSPEVPVPGSVPLGPLGDKYSMASLAAFLEDPLAVRPSGRMPDLRLDHFAAVDIASYLVRERADPGPEVPREPGLVQRGRELFVQHRCVACHRTDGWAPPPPLAALDTVNPERGCLSGQPGAWPRYPLSDTQRAAVRAALSTAREPLEAGETLDLALTRLNCVACHQRGEVGGPGPDRTGYFTGADPNLGESGRLPPPLTGVGAKLKAGALRDAVANGASVRPYLHTRMPRFGPAVAGELVERFKQVDRLPPAGISRVDAAGKPDEVGRELAGSKGFNCIACHTFRGQSAAPLRALDLMALPDRLEEEWFHQYLANPQRFSPQTIMPNFWPDGKSSLPAMLGGDPGRQRDALWQWLARGPEAGEPRGLVLEPLVVEVKDEAVIIRRAFPGIGKRGIGVGYPAGIHLAFDAGQMRLGSIWNGGFIEASGLWRGQGAGQAGIRGRDRVDFPSGVAFAVLESATTLWPTNQARQAEGFAFKGYWLDARQRPTFRYEFAGLRVEDAFLDGKGADGKPHFVRTLTFSGRPPPPGLHFRVAADPVIEPLGPVEYAVGKRLRVRLSAPGRVRDVAGQRELVMPVTGSFTVEYHLHDTP